MYIKKYIWIWVTLLSFFFVPSLVVNLRMAKSLLTKCNAIQQRLFFFLSISTTWVTPIMHIAAMLQQWWNICSSNIIQQFQKNKDNGKCNKMEICVCIVASVMLFELGDSEIELISIIQNKRKTSDSSFSGFDINLSRLSCEHHKNWHPVAQSTVFWRLGGSILKDPHLNLNDW